LHRVRTLHDRPQTDPEACRSLVGSKYSIKYLTKRICVWYRTL